MKHQLFGEFSFEELTEIVGLLETQQTTDRLKSTEFDLNGEHGNYSFIIDEDGNCEVYNEA